MNNMRTEALAAEAILDRKLRIDLPAPRILRMLGRRTVPFRFKRPTAGQLLEISAMYVRMGIDVKQLDDGEATVVIEHIARHCAVCCRIIATGLLRGPLLRAFMVRPLARYLRNHVDMATLASLTKAIVCLSGCENFAIIIRSLANLRITAPTLSRQENGS